MLKILDKDGKVRYVLFDESTEPVSIEQLDLLPKKKKEVQQENKDAAR